MALISDKDYFAGIADERRATGALINAVLEYNVAIESCANEPEKMASFCTAKGKNLDALYLRMIEVANTMKAKGRYS